MEKNEEARKRIGQRIAEIRKAHVWTDENGIRRRGMTQTELAKLTGIMQGNIARIESGKYNVTFDTLTAIGTVLDKELDYK